MLSALKKGLVAAGLAVCVLAIPATAIAGTTDGQGAQKSPLTDVTAGTAACQGPVGGTVTAHSFATNVLDPTTGYVTTTVHLQDATPNTTYYVDVYDQDCNFVQVSGAGYGVSLTTNSQGNGAVSSTSSANDPTLTSVTVGLWILGPTGYSIVFESNLVPLS